MRNFPSKLTGFMKLCWNIQHKWPKYPLKHSHCALPLSSCCWLGSRWPLHNFSMMMVTTAQQSRVWNNQSLALIPNCYQPPPPLDNTCCAPQSCRYLATAEESGRGGGLQYKVITGSIAKFNGKVCNWVYCFHPVSSLVFTLLHLSRPGCTGVTVQMEIQGHILWIAFNKHKEIINILNIDWNYAFRKGLFGTPCRCRYQVSSRFTKLLDLNVFRKR